MWALSVAKDGLWYVLLIAMWTQIGDNWQEKVKAEDFSVYDKISCMHHYDLVALLSNILGFKIRQVESSGQTDEPSLVNFNNRRPKLIARIQKIARIPNNSPAARHSH